MEAGHEATMKAWDLHHCGKTADAVALLDSAILWLQPRQAVESIAYNRAQVLIDAGRYKDAEAGLREVIRLPPGSSEPGCPSAELVDCLFMALAAGGGEMDVAVIRWMIADAQDRGDAVGALNFAAILISCLIDSSPDEARELARRWRTEADLLGEEGHILGLTEIIHKLDEKKPD